MSSTLIVILKNFEASLNLIYHLFTKLFCTWWGELGIRVSFRRGIVSGGDYVQGGLCPFPAWIQIKIIGVHHIVVYNCHSWTMWQVRSMASTSPLVLLGNMCHITDVKHGWVTPEKYKYACNLLVLNNKLHTSALCCFKMHALTAACHVCKALWVAGALLYGRPSILHWTTMQTADPITKINHSESPTLESSFWTSESLTGEWCAPYVDGNLVTCKNM